MPDVEVVDGQTDGEIAIRLPVLVIENLDTSDGRFLAAGGLTHRALPLPLLAQPESAHGGDEPGPAGVVGRIDTLTRTPGPEVISPRTGEPFPEGTFVWSGTGVLAANAKVGAVDIADLFKRRFLRGVSVDLAGMDFEVIGEDGGMAAEPEFPRRRLVAHSAEIAAATLVVVPAFGDAYVELVDQDVPDEPIAPEELPEGFCASAFPAWRSAEVGDYPALVASADTWPAGVPADAVEQLAAVIADDNGQQRDASELATAIVDYIAAQWASGDADTEMPAEGEVPAMAADDMPDLPEADTPDEVGMPDAPQSCEFGDHPAVMSLMFDEDTKYLATCADDEQQGRDLIEQNGATVSRVVDIGQPDDADDTEEIPA